MRLGSSSSSSSAVRQERCIILCIRHAEGVTPEQGYAIRDLLNSVETSGWWFLNPGTFLVAFLASKSGNSRAIACQDSLRQLFAPEGSFASVAIGIAEGAVLGSFSDAGVLESMPSGNAVNEAMKGAVQNAS
jgi:hypothetical protein